MKIVGIDPSLRAPGLAAIIDGRATGAETLRRPEWTKAPTTEEDRLDRLADVMRTMHAWAYRADLVVVEGLGYDSHDTRRQLAGLNWSLRMQLHETGHRVVVVPPSTLRVFMGVGARAPKADVVVRAEVFGVEVEDDNAADALWLAEVGAAYLGCSVLAGSPERLSLLRGVLWPSSDLAA